MEFKTQPMKDDHLFNIEYYDAKTIVRSNKGSDNFNLNPYQGCWHDCVYCDGKAENYHMHADFGTRIRVKQNAPELVEAHLKKKGLIPVNRKHTGTLLDFADEPVEEIVSSPDLTVFIGGGVCDVYQPAEKEVMMTRRLLELAYDYNLQIFVLTKNKLVLRDLDLLKKINERSKATVAMSIAFDSDEVQAIFEPNASSTTERFETLATLEKEGINTGIWFMPILPWIGDTEENMESIFRRAGMANVEWMVWSGMTLKPGRQKQQFMGIIAEHYPELLSNYEMVYGNNNKWGMPDKLAFRRMGLQDKLDKGRRYLTKYGIQSKGWIGDGKW